MPAHAVDLETKQQGQTRLLPPYSYSISIKTINNLVTMKR